MEAKEKSMTIWEYLKLLPASKRVFLKCYRKPVNILNHEDNIKHS